MRFVIKQSDFLKELQYTQGVVERRNTVPILSHVLLEAAGKNLLITATDLDVSIRCTSAADIQVGGAIAVSARKLFEIIRLLPNSDIQFKTLDQGWVQIVCEKSKFKVAGLEKEDFPGIPAVEKKTISLPALVLRGMITRCISAITQEESRYTLNGALMVLQSGSLGLVATDGHRLALITQKVKGIKLEEEKRVIIPKKTLVELSKLISEEEPIIEFASDENHLFFQVGARVLVSRTLVGQFPNYEMVIPRENNKTIVMGVVAFTSALRRAAVLADEQSRAVRLSFKKDQLDISATSANVGEARETVGVDYHGEPFEIGFNAQYLLDFLVNLESEEVVLEARDGETQGLLKPKPDGDSLYHYVIMPMKL